MNQSSTSTKIIFISIFIVLFTSVTFGQTGGTIPVSQTLTIAAKIGDKKSGAISISELLSENKLTLSPPYDTTLKIASFRLTRVRKGESPIEMNNTENGDLTASMIELIKSCKEGDKLYFEYIKCKDKNGLLVSMGALSFIIN